jgi:hypothetical protein
MLSMGILTRSKVPCGILVELDASPSAVLDCSHNSLRHLYRYRILIVEALLLILNSVWHPHLVLGDVDSRLFLWQLLFRLHHGKYLREPRSVLKKFEHWISYLRYPISGFSEWQLFPWLVVSHISREICNVSFTWCARYTIKWLLGKHGIIFILSRTVLTHHELEYALHLRKKIRSKIITFFSMFINLFCVSFLSANIPSNF